MSTRILYNGSTLTTLDDGSSATLSTAEKYVPYNLIVTDTTDVSDALEAIADKGVTVPSDAGRDDLADLISQIQQTGSGITITDTLDAAGGTYRQINAVTLDDDTVTADKMLKGTTAHNALGEAITGTGYMLNLSQNEFWMGAEIEFVEKFYQNQKLLKDTNFNTWTPSTTASTMIASSSLTARAIDLANYEYYIEWLWDYVGAFNSGATMKAQIRRQCGTLYQTIYRRPYGLANIAAKTDTYAYCTSAVTASSYCFYYNTSGTSTWNTGISYGFYPSAVAATFSSTESTTPNLTIKTPTINMRCYSSYLATARAPEIDKNTATFTVIGNLYRIKAGTSFLHQCFHKAIDIYNAPLTIS